MTGRLTPLRLVDGAMKPHRRATVTLEIVCPAWCIELPGDHAAELDDHDGRCLHLGAHVVAEDHDRLGVDDQTGDLTRQSSAEPVHVYMYAVGDLRGRETSTPSVFLNQAGTMLECSVDQVVEVAAAIREVLHAHRLAVALDSTQGPGVDVFRAHFFDEVRPADPVHVYVHAGDDQPGREGPPRRLCVNQAGTVLTVAMPQARDLAAAICQVVDTYRTAGGVHLGAAVPKEGSR